MIVGDSCVHFFIIRKNEMRCSLLFKFLVKILKKSLFIMSQFILLISNRVSVIILVQKMLHFSFCDIFYYHLKMGQSIGPYPFLQLDNILTRCVNKKKKNFTYVVFFRQDESATQQRLKGSISVHFGTIKKQKYKAPLSPSLYLCFFFKSHSTTNIINILNS